jgi:hypothetical protein
MDQKVFGFYLVGIIRILMEEIGGFLVSTILFRKYADPCKSLL